MSIRIFGVERLVSLPIELVGRTGARACDVAHGRDDRHVYVIHLAAGGQIGPHPAGFDQILLAVQGAGWVSGVDGRRHPLAQGQVAFVPPGEVHVKGSDPGLVAVMVQASFFDAPPGCGVARAWP